MNRRRETNPDRWVGRPVVSPGGERTPRMVRTPRRNVNWIET
ncbi:hypothetical protein [Haladaptatus halobius]|nr:hypothetical protein [Haladaptatus halobius]